ncbi:inositol monophosphatase [archaeon]|jgi:myo-inositol-1(or 4)-monophosphatase|nr:inositol monophosphatase [archaeon]
MKHTKKLIEIIEIAGQEIIKSFRNKSKETKLGNKLITTDANFNSEKIILSKLKKEFPGHYFSIDSKENLAKINNKSVWVIDSLDGTGNFSRGIPLFGASICLLENKVPVLGLISIPALQITLIAEKGKGTKIRGHEIKVSNIDLLKNSFIYLPTAWKEYKKIFSLMGKICPPTQMTRQIDSTAFSLAQVALGEAEALIHYESVPNDLLAGVLLVREAGGKVTDWEGKEWNFESKNIIASNEKIHKKIIEII